MLGMAADNYFKKYICTVREAGDIVDGNMEVQVQHQPDKDKNNYLVN